MSKPPPEINSKPAIVLSTGTAALGVIRSLGERGVPVIALYQDPTDVGCASRYLREAIQVPHPEHEEKAFVELLLRQAPRLGGGVLMPCADSYLGTVARNKAELQQHYLVACPDWKIAQSVLQKSLTYEVARAAGVATPHTAVLRSLAHAEQEARKVSFPCLVKPVTGHQYSRVFHRKMVLARCPEELIAAYREATDADCAVMLQEFIPGEDAMGVNYNAYFWEGEPLAEFTAAKIRNAPPQLGSPRVVVSKHIPEVIEPGRRLLRALGYSGFSCTEFKWDARDRSYKLMEVNGRHNMSSRLAPSCGMNFPFLEYRHLAYGEKPAPCDFEDGTYWIELSRDAAHTLKHWRRERYSLARYLEPYRRRHVFAELEWDDPRPFLNRCRSAFSKRMAGLLCRLLPVGVAFQEVVESGCL
jgi:predicted ATP-grasp superfamily ATP-dependent carboligase